MKIDHETQALLKRNKFKNLIPLRYVPLWLARRDFGAFGYKSDAPLANVENITISGPHGKIPLRLYTPQTEGRFSVLIAIHGGGWIIGKVLLILHCI